jgi:hypothetical protein
MNNHEIHPRKFMVFLVLFAAAMILPYAVAGITGGDTHVFGGFLLNPLDGNSYLAKMQQGAGGSWRFTLPFTAEPGQGAFIFLFYLTLGHLCRLTGLPLIWMFHIWRVAGGLFLVFSLRQFFQYIFGDDIKTAWRAFVLAGIGSGLGWTVFVFGQMTGDFWVAEAYPFLSSYANPHFPIGLGLMLWILLFAFGGKRGYWQIAGLALLLGVIMPFGVAIVCMVLAGMALLDYVKERKANVLPLILTGVFGGAMIAYQVGVTIWDPVFASWNAQNVTPATAWWDFLLSFSPVLLVAAMGMMLARKEIRQEKVVLLAVWLVGAVVLILLPVRLQRRFVLGLYIPLAGLGVYGCKVLAKRLKVSPARIYKLVLWLSIPTNVVLLLAGVLGAASKNPMIYLTQAEEDALRWLANQPAGECLVLAAPQLSLYVPGRSGCKVMYGHPYESVNAQQEEARVEAFYQGNLSEEEAWAYLLENRIDLIVYGEREADLGSPKILQALPVVFEAAEVRVYSVENP